MTFHYVCPGGANQGLPGEGEDPRLVKGTEPGSGGSEVAVHPVLEVTGLLMKSPLHLHQSPDPMEVTMAHQSFTALTQMVVGCTTVD